MSLPDSGSSVFSGEMASGDAAGNIAGMPAIVIPALGRRSMPMRQWNWVLRSMTSKVCLKMSPLTRTGSRTCPMRGVSLPFAAREMVPEAGRRVPLLASKSAGEMTETFGNTMRQGGLNSEWVRAV